MSDVELRADLLAVAGLISAGDDFFVKKSGLLKFMLSASGPSQRLLAVNFPQLKADFLSLDDATRLDEEAAFKAALPPGMQPVVGQGENLIEKCITLAEKLVGCYHDSLSIVADFKSLFGI